MLGYTKRQHLHWRTLSVIVRHQLGITSHNTEDSGITFFGLIKISNRSTHVRYRCQRHYTMHLDRILAKQRTVFRQL